MLVCYMVECYNCHEDKIIMGVIFIDKIDNYDIKVGNVPFCSKDCLNHLVNELGIEQHE